jgi:hypothetical protein
MRERVDTTTHGEENVRVTFAHICDYAMVAQDGKLSVLGIFGAIAAKSVPVQHPSLFLAFEVELNYAEAKKGGALRIEMVDEDGKPMVQVKAELKYEGLTKIGNNPRIGQVVGLQQLQFARFGPYNVNFFCNDELNLQMAFEVAPLPQPPLPPQSPPQHPFPGRR